MGVGFLRDADWLGADRVRGYLWLFAAINLATLLFLVVTSHDGVDRNGFLLGSDFISFWTAGRMLHSGGHVYDVAAHIEAQRRYFAPANGYTAFFYPPPFLIACYPLGLLQYFPALAAWLATTGAAFLAVVRLWLRETRIRQPLLLLAAAFPPVLITVTHGQTSFLVAALLALGAFWVRRRPELAGICFGLATIKPQFGLLVPLVLLATREWRVIVAAAATAAVLFGLATLAFGVGVWADWFAVTGAAQDAMSGGAVGFGKMQSVFAAGRLLGVSTGAAYVLQTAVALAAAGALAWAGWGRGYTPALASAMLVGALLATPFVLDYDMVLLAFPLIWLAGREFRPWEKIVVVAAFVAAAFARPLALYLAMPIMPLVLACLFVVLIRRAAEAGPPFQSLHSN
jgi:hypothetical protein